MKIEGIGKLLRIYIGIQDRYRGQPLYEAIVEKAKSLGMAGSTVIRGIEGFGADSRVIHRANLLRLSQDLPLLIEIVDTEKRIQAGIEEFGKMIEEAGSGALMTLESVEILHYKTGKQNAGQE